MKVQNITPPEDIDNKTLKELEDLYAMRASSRLNQQAILAEQLGTAGLIKGKLLQHRKPNLIRRILGLK